MCISTPSAPKPPPPPPPAAPPVPVPELKTSRDDPAMDKSINAMNRKGRGKLRIDMGAGGSEGTGLNIPQ